MNTLLTDPRDAQTAHSSSPLQRARKNRHPTNTNDTTQSHPISCVQHRVPERLQTRHLHSTGPGCAPLHARPRSLAALIQLRPPPCLSRGEKFDPAQNRHRPNIVPPQLGPNVRRTEALSDSVPHRLARVRAPILSLIPRLPSTNPLHLGQNELRASSTSSSLVPLG
jgi:hypothetical protein